MTEQQWLSATDPHCMLTHIWNSGLFTRRKSRLLAAHCSRRVLPLIAEPLATKAVRLCEDDCEQNGDEAALLTTLTELKERIAGDIPAGVRYQAGMGMVMAMSAGGSNCTVYGLGLHSLANSVAWAADPGATVHIDDWASPHDPVWNAARAVEREAQANLLREIVPNPFRPARFTSAS